MTPSAILTLLLVWGTVTGFAIRYFWLVLRSPGTPEPPEPPG